MIEQNGDVEEVRPRLKSFVECIKTVVHSIPIHRRYAKYDDVRYAMHFINKGKDRPIVRA